MDPWGGFSSANSSGSGSSAENIFVKDTFTCQTVPPTDAKSAQNELPFEKLPDSAEYLELLQKKLKKLEKKRGELRPGQTKEEILSGLIRSDSKQIIGILSNTDFELDREIQPNSFLRHIVPQQPLSHGETVHLIKSDQLDLASSESETHQQDHLSSSK